MLNPSRSYLLSELRKGNKAFEPPSRELPMWSKNKSVQDEAFKFLRKSYEAITQTIKSERWNAVEEGLYVGSTPICIKEARTLITEDISSIELLEQAWDDLWRHFTNPAHKKALSIIPRFSLSIAKEMEIIYARYQAMRAGRGKKPLSLVKTYTPAQVANTSHPNINMTANLYYVFLPTSALAIDHANNYLSLVKTLSTQVEEWCNDVYCHPYRHDKRPTTPYFVMELENTLGKKRIKNIFLPLQEFELIQKEQLVHGIYLFYGTLPGVSVQENGYQQSLDYLHLEAYLCVPYQKTYPAYMRQHFLQALKHCMPCIEAWQAHIEQMPLLHKYQSAIRALISFIAHIPQENMTVAKQVTAKRFNDYFCDHFQELLDGLTVRQGVLQNVTTIMKGMKGIFWKNTSTKGAQKWVEETQKFEAGLQVKFESFLTNFILGFDHLGLPGETLSLDQTPPIERRVPATEEDAPLLRHRFSSYGGI